MATITARDGMEVRRCILRQMALTTRLVWALVMVAACSRVDPPPKATPSEPDPEKPAIVAPEQPPPTIGQPEPKNCPACGFGCLEPGSVPSSKLDENGCPVCGCEQLVKPPEPAQPKEAPPPEPEKPAIVAPKRKPRPKPTVVQPKGKNCPVCGFACTKPGTVPSRKVDENGCRRCGCEDLLELAKP